MTHEINGLAAISQVISLIPFISQGWEDPQEKQHVRPCTLLDTLNKHAMMLHNSLWSLSATISSCLQSWGAACRGLFPRKPYFALVHDGFWLPAEWLMKKRSLHRDDIWNVTKVSGWSYILVDPLFLISILHLNKKASAWAQSSTNNEQITVYRAAASDTVLCLSFLW